MADVDVSLTRLVFLKVRRRRGITFSRPLCYVFCPPSQDLATDAMTYGASSRRRRVVDAVATPALVPGSAGFLAAVALLSRDQGIGASLRSIVDAIAADFASKLVPDALVDVTQRVRVVFAAANNASAAVFLLGSPDVRVVTCKLPFRTFFHCESRFLLQGTLAAASPSPTETRHNGTGINNASSTVASGSSMLVPAVVGGFIALSVLFFCLFIVGLCLCMCVFCRKEHKRRDIVPTATGHVLPNRPAAPRRPKLGADDVAHHVPVCLAPEPRDVVDVFVGVEEAPVFDSTRSGPTDEVPHPRYPHALTADITPGDPFIENTAARAVHPPDHHGAHGHSDRVVLADAERRQLVERLVRLARELAERHAHEAQEEERSATQASCEIISPGRHSTLTDRHFNEASYAAEVVKAEADGLEGSLVERFGQTQASYPAGALAMRFQSAYAAHRRALQSGLPRGTAHPPNYAHELASGAPVQASVGFVACMQILMGRVS